MLDLGSGAGKICFIAAQVVGATGKIIGIDMTDEMLALARRNAPIVAERLGYANVEFRKGRIQDLALDVHSLLIGFFIVAFTEERTQPKRVGALAFEGILRLIEGRGSKK